MEFKIVVFIANCTMFCVHRVGILSKSRVPGISLETGAADVITALQPRPARGTLRAIDVIGRRELCGRRLDARDAQRQTTGVT